MFSSLYFKNIYNNSINIICIVLSCDCSYYNILSIKKWNNIQIGTGAFDSDFCLKSIVIPSKITMIIESIVKKSERTSPLAIAKNSNAKHVAVNHPYSFNSLVMVKDIYFAVTETGWHPLIKD